MKTVVSQSLHSNHTSPKDYSHVQTHGIKISAAVQCLVTVSVMLACSVIPTGLYAGSVFVSGHDADFHATQGNQLGAQHLIQRSFAFARDGNSTPFLFLQSNTSNIGLGDHLDSEAGLIASGFVAGTDYVKVNATDFATIDLSLYSALFIPSDHGGTLTGDDLRALNARQTDILNYLNAGGGLVAFAEDGSRQPASADPQPVEFGFLPFLTSSATTDPFEQGYTLTPFGLSLGLTNSDVNDNFSHNVFTSTAGMNIVDTDPTGQIISLAFRGRFTASGAIPEPRTSTLLTIGLASLVVLLRRGKTR